jgi:hypothetical protein
MIGSATVRAAMLLAVAALLATACSSEAPDVRPTPSTPAASTPIGQPTGTHEPSETALPTITPPEAGTARIRTTGDVETTLTMPWDTEFGEFPTGDGEFDLRFQDEDLNTLLVTVELTGAEVTRSFVGVGVPGTAIDDRDYYADFFNLNCDVELSRLEDDAVEGTFDCTNLGNGAGNRSVDASGAFSAIP